MKQRNPRRLPGTLVRLIIKPLTYGNYYGRYLNVYRRVITIVEEFASSLQLLLLRSNSIEKYQIAFEDNYANGRVMSRSGLAHKTNKNTEREITLVEVFLGNL